MKKKDVGKEDKKITAGKVGKVVKPVKRVSKVSSLTKVSRSINGTAASAISGAILTAVLGNYESGRVRQNAIREEPLVPREIFSEVMSQCKHSFWNFRGCWDADCLRSLGVPRLGPQLLCNPFDDDDYSEPISSFTAAAKAPVSELHPPFLENLKPGSIRMTQSIMKGAIISWKDVIWYLERRRPILAAWCLKMCWSNAKRSPTEPILNSEGANAADAAVASVVALISLETNPIEMMSWFYDHTGETTKPMPPFIKTLISDFRIVGNLYDGQEIIQTGPFVLNSRFDSGAMGHSSWDESTNTLTVDAYYDGGGNKRWFYFEIKRTVPTSRITLSISQIGRAVALYKPKEGYAHRPVISYGGGPFKKIGSPPKLIDKDFPPDYIRDKGEKERSSLVFDVSFCDEVNSIAIAFTYPYTTNSVASNIDRWMATTAVSKVDVDGPAIRSDSVSTPPPSPSLNCPPMVSSELLTISPDCHDIPLITITGESPDGGDHKQFLIISARVHAGEVPASYLLHGIVTFLLSDEPAAHKLRSKYIYKIIPILNPDGVYRGYSRADGRGVNLNRVYDNPHRVLHSSVWAARHVIESIYKAATIIGYLDLHAHARKRSVFSYGNFLSGEEGDLQNTLCFLVGLRTEYWDYHNCDFSDAEFLKKDKMGTGRVSIGERLGIPISWTIEANYSNGECISYKSGRPTRVISQQFTPQIFYSVARGILVAFLDISRESDPDRDAIPCFANMERVRKYINSCPTPGNKKKAKKNEEPSSPSAMSRNSQNASETGNN
eukprot:TRINITY_DN24336_c0_g1_i1.p1 TRINITY_DN24336_c0_g1~~TRINITY_DN24336_c0_g1_i1.p1  ORF type:complete len:778 (+),score=137.50 TRINITY_DN24336_c0_g1_i1:123-2456(+)